jgi:arginyl-tRNA synthetase
MKVEEKIAREVSKIIEDSFGQQVAPDSISLQKTRKEFDGDFTLVVFPFVKIARRSPEQTAQMLGEALVKQVDEVATFNVIKGFLNLKLAPAYWLEFLPAGNEQSPFWPACRPGSSARCGRIFFPEHQ